VRGLFPRALCKRRSASCSAVFNPRKPLALQQLAQITPEVAYQTPIEASNCTRPPTHSFSILRPQVSPLQNQIQLNQTQRTRTHLPVPPPLETLITQPKSVPFGAQNLDPIARTIEKYKRVREHPRPRHRVRSQRQTIRAAVAPENDCWRRSAVACCLAVARLLRAQSRAPAT